MCLKAFDFFFLLSSRRQAQQLVCYFVTLKKQKEILR